MSDTPHPRTTPEAQREIHDSIYRERVLRARALTPEQRFNDGLELTNSVMQLNLEGAMWQLGTDDLDLGWQEARRRMMRLCHARDHKFYTVTPAAS